MICLIRRTRNTEVIVLCKRYIRNYDTAQSIKYIEKPERDTAFQEDARGQRHVREYAQMSAVRGCPLFRCWWLSSPLNKSKRRTEICDNATTCTSLQEHEISHHFTNCISEIKYCFSFHLFMNHTACVLKIYDTKLIGDTDQSCIICRWKLNCTVLP
jgi:hypothetical protein